MTNTEPLDLDAIEARVEKADSWLDAHTNAHSGRKGDVRAYVQDVPALIAEVRRLREAAANPQMVIDDHMQAVAHRVLAAFEEADEETLADEIQEDVYAAIGLLAAFGAAPHSPTLEETR